MTRDELVTAVAETLTEWFDGRNDHWRRESVDVLVELIGKWSRDDERSRIADDMARWARDNTAVGRPTRAAWFLQIAEKIRTRRDAS